MPRRRSGVLLPLEIEIITVALAMRQAGEAAFHGFALAQAMQTDRAARLTGHGTLYKALGRLEEMGLLSSRWEDPAPTGRPRRRLYELTPAGAVAARSAREVAPKPSIRGRLAPGTT